MPSFPKPKFEYQVKLATEIKALRKYRDSKPTLQIPASKPTNLLLATWNIANFGDQERKPVHLKIIAEMISWFDIVAIQEIKNNSLHFQEVVKLLGKDFRFIFSDASGNNERMGYIYRATKVALLFEVGEVAIPPSQFKSIKLEGVTTSFQGFDRSPFLSSFKVKSFDFSLMNVHLYFGTENETASIERRCLEAYCVGRWADLRSNSKYSYTTNIFALGDFNLPMVDEKDPVYKALVQKGLQLPDHTSKIYSNLNDDKAYDQIAFLPGMKSAILSHGVFPFDNALFAEVYKTKTPAEFRSFVKYFISDHRPMWMELSIT